MSPNNSEVVEALRTTLKERDRLQRENLRLRAGASEPIAIVGMACRYPGGIASPRDLWQMVAEGRDGIGEFPVDRGWDLERLYHPDPDHPGTTYAREGGFLAEAGEFDAEFFSISPREALVMDPQERLLLEACWEALEDAGIDPGSLKKSQTGVFAGVGERGYGPSAGTTSSIISGRVSYALGLEGPSISIDTACSSSLVALHLSSQALRQGECTLALAGGVTVLSTPGAFVAFSAQRGLAPDGRCKPFADAADGTGWAEGVGMLALERLSDAQRNGHPVLALLKGSAVNQDGASNGLTAPNGPSQERVIRQALASANLTPQDVDAVEAHGTGTTLGDPIEAGALLATYGQDRERPLKLGSIKSNIGHTQAAAGVAGVIKMTQAMREGALPKTLHVDAPSSHVEWEAGEIELLSEPVEWEANGRPRRAGVSSFGISGTNAHVILEQAPAVEPDAEEAATARFLLGQIPLSLSAKVGPALAESAQRLAVRLQANPDLDPTDLAYSLATTRATFEHRAVALGKDREELLASLAALANGDPSPNVLSAKAKDGKLAYLFTGQGSQRLGMGKELYEADANFRNAFDQACEQLDQHLGKPLKEIVFAKGKKAAALLEDTTYAQPALFAIEVALHRALAERGLSPDLLTGHSIGEIAAAHVAGVLDLDDAAKLVTARGRLMGALPTGGAMAAIEATEAEVAKSIAGKEDELSIAAINAPSSIVISGAEEAVEAIRTEWEEKGKKTKRLAVSHAFHSPLMEPMLKEFAEVANSLTFNEPKLPIVSNVSGELLSPEQATDPAYWVSHVRAPVRFADAIATLKAQGTSTYLELGPDPVLCAMARECLGTEQDNAAFLPTLREGRTEGGAVSIAIAGAHVAGAKLDWGAFFKGTGAKRVPLPTYPFQRKRYWLALTPSGGGDLRAAGLADPGHPLLAATVEDPGTGGLTLTGRLSLATQAWITDDLLPGTALLPTSTYIELALKAAHEAGGQGIAELGLHSSLILPESGSVAIQVTVSGPDEEGLRELAIHSRPEGEEAEWVRHASGTLSAQQLPTPEPLDTWPPQSAGKADVRHAEVSLPEEQAHEAESFALHPALLDSALQAVGLTRQDGDRIELPSAWENFALHSTGASTLRLLLSTEDGVQSLSAYDQAGTPLFSAASVKTRPLDLKELGSAQRRRSLHKVNWQPIPTTEAQASEGEVAEITPAEGEIPQAAQATAEGALALLQEWVTDEANENSRLTLLTHNAIATSEEEAPDLRSAAVWGLVRSAVSEHPGRFALIDTDDSEASKAAIPAVLALGADEPQLALREGEALAPRLTRVKADQKPSAKPLDPEHTVLITGGLSGLGALVARHLVTNQEAKHLLLVSRRGPEATGAEELKAELQELGAAEVTISACDVTDRSALEELFAQVPKEHPLGAIIHSAGTIDDGVLESMDPERLKRTMAPKATAAWHLHELSKELELSQFLLFSSAAGLLGGAAQTNYAAANNFLDALAALRRSEGLAGTALAWGLWNQRSSLAGELSAGLQDNEEVMERLANQIRQRLGFARMTPEQGLELFDAARELSDAVLAPVRFDPAALRARAEGGTLAPILSTLTRASARQEEKRGTLGALLAEIPEAERSAVVLDLVRSNAAAVLGHSSPEEVGPRRAFQEMGLDSLGALELRNRLNAATGLDIGATVVFDYPSSAALSEYLLAEAIAGGISKQVVLRTQASEEPIAIVGMACRYPGGIASPEDLWQLVAEGRDAISEFPTDRGWDIERLYNPDRENPGTSYTREAGFLADAGSFDPDFFAISPREALFMDPQERLLLELSWEALERTGVEPVSLRGTQTGVFAGVAYQDYGLLTMSSSLISGRVSYTLGLEGPAISIDTACSSSLVAMHLASQALRQGECTLALTGGVTTVATPDVFVEFSRQRALSPDGRCKSFAESADGTGWGEGVGVLVLERLSDARRNGHQALALLKGSAINQDGASNGLTAPNGPSQERVIRQALANAQLEAKDVDVVEAHGTGTTLGDPIEAGALLATYGQEREKPLKLGSLKSNIGHTQAAAGVGGVIKMAMAMREGVLPKTLHVDAPSSKVDWEAGEIELLSEPAEWGANGRPRRAGVSSFGISGTNAHVILEQAPEPVVEERTKAKSLPTPIPLTLSAKTGPALTEAAERLATHLTANPDLDPTDVAFSLATTRTAFKHRALVMGSDREQLLGSLGALSREEESPGITRGLASTEGPPVFIYPGQGSQWEGMALDLLETSEPFATKFSECEEALLPHIDWSLKDVLSSAEGAPSIKQIEVVQPALFAVMASLSELWRSAGIRPAAVAGHSQGEIVAAHVAGALSIEDAAMLAALRSKIISRLAGKGGMVSIALPTEELDSHLEPWGERIEVAAHNGPSSTILSGDRQALDQLLEHCTEQDIRAREIPAAIASHSAYVEELREEVLETLAPISPQSAEIPFHSTVTGGRLDTTELDAAYWYRNLRETVQFEQVTRGLLQDGHRVFIEVSPHPVFALAVGETIEATLPDPDQATALGTLRRDEDGSGCFAASLARAYCAGAEVDWEAFFAGTQARAVGLPTYPFQRERYWLEHPKGSGDVSAVGLSATGHPLLGAALELAGAEGLLLTGRLSLDAHPWLADHAVSGTVLLPATAFLELALRAAEQVGAETVEELTMQAPLVLTEGGAAALQVSVSPAAEDGRREVTIHARPEGEDGEWIAHATGMLSERLVAAAEPLDVWPPEGAMPLEVDYIYDRLAELGVEYGPAFQGLTAAWRDGEKIYAEVSLPEQVAHEAESFAIHPALLDSALQSAMLARLDDRAASDFGFPFTWREVGLMAVGARQGRVRLTLGDGALGLEMADGEGVPLAAVGSLDFRPLDSPQAQAGGGGDLLAVEWVEAALDTEVAEPPEVELVRCEIEADVATVEAARSALQSTRADVQRWLATEAETESRLALVTRGAIAAGEGEVPDPAAAAVWALIRSAQAEHPGRFLLIDSDASEASQAALSAALVKGAEEPELALRDGTALAPRLTRLVANESGAVPIAIDPERTVLITGAGSGSGALAARHLVQRHGARHLLLVAGDRAEEPGAEALKEELGGLGAEVEVAVCDAADRESLQAAFASISTQHPLGAVVHCAAVLADGMIESLDREQLNLVFAAKAQSAWNLHELSAGSDLSAFVLFSSVTGAIGLAGQASYAAANAFLDALAQQRRAAGQPAVSIGWGLWEHQSGRSSGLGEADLARLGRQGIEALSDEGGLALFDRALDADRATALALRLGLSGLRVMASSGELPPIFAGLVRAPKRRSAVSGSLGAKLATLPEAEAQGLALDLVRSEVAAVLGHASGQQVEPGRAFKDLGFDSLTAVELRNRLSAVAGLRLPATVVFDYPSPAVLAEHLVAAAGASGAAGQVAVRARASEEPIAIVGMACRYPGGVSSPRELWQLVAEGRDAITEFPEDRGWDIERLYNPDPENQGTSYAREGGFLADAGEFDPGFFSIGPREALSMDPQERLLLESSWEALEDAGLDPSSLRKTQTGVFAGVAYQDYGPFPVMSSSVVSGRVSYALGLEGPAISVNTACSSSLVAMHLAAQALRQGECDLALAGGVTVISSPGVFLDFSRQRGLAPDGRCKSFAEAADGAGFSDGVGVLVLERLSEARQNGHPVLALLKGSAVNQDGASNGLTAPNGPSQERVIRQALANAGLSHRDVDAVEAHGTGTTLGDPIEAGALLATYGQEREKPLKLGSLKSNIGHTQAAAGVGGVIKMTEAMRRGVLPKTLHVDAPSSKIEWETGQIELLTEQAPWEPNGHPRRAGVSSFGVSGTNAHVILEQAPELPVGDRHEGESSGASPRELPTPTLLTLSAKTEPALFQAAARLGAHLKDNPELDPKDVAYSLPMTRSSFEHRAVVLGTESKELIASLDALAQGTDSPTTAKGSARQEQKPLFLFPGQGAQSQGMALGLLESSPPFAAQMAACEEALAPHVEWSLTEVLREEDGKWLDRLDMVQPALFSVMVSLARLWRECGVTPQALVGHSQGEIAAAHIAGALSLEDAALIIAKRGQAMAKIAGKGGMLSVSLTPQQLPPYAEPFGERLSLAAINGPASLVLSGDPVALKEIQAAFEAEGIRAQAIAVDYAAHSTQIEALEEELLEAFAPISPQATEIPLHSTVTGGLIEGGELGPDYWYRNLRQTVLLEPVLRSALEGGQRALIEIGPHPVLAFGVQETIEEVLDDPSEAILLSTLRREESEPERFALSLAEAHAKGVELNWEALFAGTGAKRVPLPTYPFQRERYWLPPALGSEMDPNAATQAINQALVGPAVALAGGRGEGLLFSGRVSLQSHLWLADHAVDGMALMPAAVLLELALRAGAASGARTVEALTLQAPLVISESEAAVLQVTIADPDEEGRREVTIHSHPERDAGAWTCHASGTLAMQSTTPRASLDSWPPQGAAPLEGDDLSAFLAGVAAEYGPLFPGPDVAWKDGEQIYTEVSLYGAGTSTLRLGFGPEGNALRLDAYEAEGGLVLPLASVVVPPLAVDELRLAGQRRSLYELGEGEPLASQLTRIPADWVKRAAGSAWDPDATVLVGGDLDGHDGPIARHLEEAHGVGHLLLAGASELADRAALEALLGSIPSEHPLGAVVQVECAPAGDPATPPAGDALEMVLRPMLEGARNLYELTAGLRPVRLAAFSSTVGVELLEVTQDAARPLLVLPPALRGFLDEPIEEVSEPLVERLRGLSSDGREAAVLDFVRAQIAELLGYNDAAAVDTGRPFIELGVDSVAAMELRNRLDAAIGVQIPVSVLANQPTLRELAAFIARHLGSGAVAEMVDGSKETFVSLLGRAREQGQVDEFMGLLRTASHFRPSFDDPLGAGGSPPAVRLAEGPDLPSLVLMPSLVAMSGAQEYIRFAKGFRGKRPTSVMPLVGFAEAEPLPASLDAFVRSTAAAIQDSGLDASFVLAGYSSGGWVAHAVAAQLEAQGVPPMAVILLDTPSTSVDTAALLELIPALDAGLSEQLFVRPDDARLTAMAKYFQLFGEWAPVKLGAPVLMVRASEPLSATAEQIDRLEAAVEPVETVEVPGNHFTMMWDRAETTAEAVQNLIVNLAKSPEERSVNAE